VALARLRELLFGRSEVFARWCREGEGDQWRSELKAFAIILGPHSNPMSPEPNKSPEPTRGAVTPRAIEGKNEMATQTEIRHVARGVPAPRVAHL